MTKYKDTEDCSVNLAPESYESQPFPTGLLPDPLKSFVKQAAAALVCDPAYIALPLLTATAAAIGNTRRIKIKRNWAEPPIIWTGIVGPSGSLKSPAMRLALSPLQRQQHRALQLYEQYQTCYEFEISNYEAQLDDWKKRGRKQGTDKPLEPTAPVPTRYMVSDITIESLAEILKNQPRGVLCYRDELTGWIGSFDQYRSSKGADAARWLELWQAGPLMVDRKSQTNGAIYVPRASVSITGGIQPETLQRVLGREYFENGLAARLLLAMPARQIKRWSDAEVPEDIENQLEGLFDWLLSELDFRSDGEGNKIPTDVPMTTKARGIWVNFYNEHATDQSTLVGDLASTYSKLEAYAARLALVFHIVRTYAGDPHLQDVSEVDDISISTAIELVRWFGREAARIYSSMHESESQREIRSLVEMIQARGGRITVREATRIGSRYRNAAHARQELRDLANLGFGKFLKCQAGNMGGRPSEVFELDEKYLDTNALRERRRTSTKGGFVGFGIESATEHQELSVV